MKFCPQKLKAQENFKPQGLNSSKAFTLIEMTVVLGLAVIITAIILPSLRGFGETNKMGAGTRQMLDDVAYARQAAIKNHTKVYMIFISPRFWTNLVPSDPNLTSYSSDSQREIFLLNKHQYTSYALFSFHTLGDQPGQESPHYLTKWRDLPPGVIIETNKFVGTDSFVDFLDGRPYTVRPFSTRAFPFPSSELTNAVPKRAILPYIAFTPSGAVWTDAPNPPDIPADASYATRINEDELIPLARGSIFYPADTNGNPDWSQPADVVELNYRETTRTNYQIIRIDRLTGRPKLEKPELK